MNDPKYQPLQGKLFHSTGYYFVPEHEPCMIFRGKDIGAIEAICSYIEMLVDQPQNKNIVSHLESSIERLYAFYRYQKDNPDLQSIGCSRRSHEGYSAFF